MDHTSGSDTKKASGTHGKLSWMLLSMPFQKSVNKV